MGVDERKQMVLNVFSSIAEGNADPLLDMIDDDVVWTIIGDTLFSGTYKGKQDVLDRLLGRLGERVDGHLHISVDNMIGEGDFLAVQGRGESKTVDGGTYNNTYCWVYKFKDDKVVELTEYLDTEVLTASFGH